VAGARAVVAAWRDGVCNPVPNVSDLASGATMVKRGALVNAPDGANASSGSATNAIAGVNNCRI